MPELDKSMTSIPPGSRQQCSLCQVQIDAGAQGLVHFSHGAPGSRAKLWARVCQFLSSDEQRRQCINQDPSMRGVVQASDDFAQAPAIELPPYPGVAPDRPA